MNPMFTPVLRKLGVALLRSQVTATRIHGVGGIIRSNCLHKNSVTLSLKMAKYRPVTHVIFDMDGLLLDTERIYTEVTDEICSEYGKKFTWEVKVKLMGQRERDAAKIIIDELQLPLTVDECIQKVSVLQKKAFPNVPLLPGAKRLVEHLYKHNIPMAIASGSGKEKFKWKTVKHQELMNMFHHFVLSSDDPEVKHSKPAPDCFQVCAKRFPDQPSPEKILVFEDAPNGVLSGAAAGMQVVWVPDTRANRSQLLDKVSIILDTLEDFQPELFGLPPFDECHPKTDSKEATTSQM
ncbi:pseudouridine-5' [Octopus vulgaris]|uniref:pseudouridine 5'-phosphatase n=2 Tax=Octopus vulgaris TaxID=6645 RepID=A0AA36AQM1_OCTVU|nr:pseudouridine-5' [Octopus vulgaris]